MPSNSNENQPTDNCATASRRAETAVTMLSPEQVKEMEFWPEANLLPRPLPRSAEALAFADSIKAEGVRVPVIVSKGRCIDGVGRLEEAKALGLSVPAIVRDDIEDRTGFVLSNQFRRRELTKSQRAMVVADPKIRERYKAEAKARKGKKVQADLPGPSGSWREVAAADAKTSDGLVRDAAKLWDTGVAELIEMVRAGLVKATPAATVAASCSAEDQQTICAKGPDEIGKMARELIRAKKKRKPRSNAAAPRRRRFSLVRSRPDGSADSIDAEGGTTDTDDEDGDEVGRDPERALEEHGSSDDEALDLHKADTNDGDDAANQIDEASESDATAAPAESLREAARELLGDGLTVITADAPPRKLLGPTLVLPPTAPRAKRWCADLAISGVTAPAECVVLLPARLLGCAQVQQALGVSAACGALSTHMRTPPERRPQRPSERAEEEGPTRTARAPFDPQIGSQAVQRNHTEATSAPCSASHWRRLPKSGMARSTRRQNSGV